MSANRIVAPRRGAWALGLAMCLAVTPLARADELKLGAPAPALEVSKFVKGEPVKSFEPGKTYVVEFWATWCGPCRATIPHLSELQKKNPEAVFIGVDVFENDISEVEPFLKEMGDKMSYRVALDAVPEGGEPNEGKMAKNWMEAAGENGIPTAFIVNKEGKVAWIGHPMAMEKPLEKVLDGSYDLQAAADAREKAKAGERKLMAVQEKLEEAGNDARKALAVIDEALADMPDAEQMFATMKLQLLAAGKETQAKAAEYGRKLKDGVMATEAQGLNFVAWTLVDPERKVEPSKDEVAVAVEAAKKAAELTENEEPAILDTLGRALFLSGDAKGALAAQEKAVKLGKGTPIEEDEGVAARLKAYRNAVEGGKDR
jgi:thiol-disulfide isomerase/thioredoxin